MKRRPILAGCILTILLILSFAHGQWLEEAIWLPDSLTAGLYGTSAAGFCASTGEVMTAGVGGLLWLDAASGRPVARTPTAYRVEYLCINPGEELFFVAPVDRDKVGVVDARSHLIVNQLELPHHPEKLLFAPEARKAYCFCTSADVAVSIAGSGDSILAVIPLNSTSEVQSACFAPSVGKLYVTFHEVAGVTVIDCSLDIVVHTLPTVEEATFAVLGSSASKLYVGCDRTGDLLVFDVASDSLIATLPGLGAECAAWDPVRNCLFCQAEREFVVVDCAGDSITGRVANTGYHPRVVCAPASRRVYGMPEMDGALTVVDADGDSVLATLPGGARVTDLALTGLGPAYAPDCNGAQVMVIDERGDTLLPAVPVGDFQAARLVYVRGADRLYCAASEYDSRHRPVVYSLAAATRTVTGILPCLEPPVAMLAAPEVNRLYLCYGDVYRGILQVVDISGDSAVRMLTTGPGASALAWNPDRRKLYQSTSDGVYVVDADGDSIAGLVTVTAGSLLYSSATGRLYVTNGATEIKVVDGATDSVLGAVGTGGQGAGAMFMDTDSLRLYCANIESGNIGVIDARRNVRTGAIASGRGPSSFAFDPVRRRLYCANGGNWDHDSTVVVIDLDRAELMDTLRVGRGPVRVAYDSARQFIWCALKQDSAVAVIDCRTMAVRGNLELGVPAMDLAVIPQTGDVYVAGPGHSALVVLQDSVLPGVTETPLVTVTPKPLPTILRNVLTLPGNRGNDAAPTTLMDASGRKVMTLSPGPNDISHLSPGVYFIHSPIASPHSQPATKVVIQR